MVLRIVIPLAAVVVVVLLMSALVLVLGRMVRRSGIKGENKSKGTEKPEPATKKEAPEKKGSEGKETAWPAWKFFKFAFVVVSIGVLFYVVLGNLRYFLPSSTSRKVAQTADLAIDGDSFSNVPTRIAFPLIGECESPGEPGGKQFNKDGSVVRGKVDKDDIGALEINQRVHADLIKEHPEIDIARSKEDNYKFGEILVEKYHGYGPWFKSQNCWGPKLASMGFGQKTGDQTAYTRTFEVPAGEPGVEIDVPIGFDFRWGRSEGAFVVENEKGDKARFDPDNNIFEDLPWINQGEKSGYSRKLKFKSLVDKPAKVNLRFTRQSSLGSQGRARSYAPPLFFTQFLFNRKICRHNQYQKWLEQFSKYQKQKTL